MQLVFVNLDFAVVHLDDICVFSRSKKEDVKHRCTVFDTLCRKKRYARREQCVFSHVAGISLGLTITSERLAVDRNKTLAIEMWKTPTTVNELRCVEGLAETKFMSRTDTRRMLCWSSRRPSSKRQCSSCQILISNLWRRQTQVRASAPGD
ncbi:hypothetical protein PsorP6_010524 [Peronosclerospora sorghi]|uniref:Uncharacterized protein n=1 Tax=Peronosclerospora sorghi TaxID=230839 RepID=A0ACC0VYV0_9STRA|nr:hypothetical protein PsorP6_010524 [Peronosclerospora sorghi]